MVKSADGVCPDHLLHLSNPELSDPCKDSNNNHNLPLLLLITLLKFYRTG